MSLIIIFIFCLLLALLLPAFNDVVHKYLKFFLLNLLNLQLIKVYIKGAQNWINSYPPP